MLWDKVGKKCPWFMTRGTEIALYKQLRAWTISAPQTHFGIFLNLEFLLNTFYKVLKDYEEGGKVQGKAASGEMTDANRRKGARSFN